MMNPPPPPRQDLPKTFRVRQAMVRPAARFHCQASIRIFVLKLKGKPPEKGGALLHISIEPYRFIVVDGERYTLMGVVVIVSGIHSLPEFLDCIFLGKTI